MKHLLFLFASLFLSFTANSQIITSVVGGGTSGVVDGVPATASVIICPEDICFDKFGNLYITEALSHRIRKVNTSGIISTIAGTGSAGFTGDGLQATSAMLNQPSGITSDTSGNIFFCDQANNRIRRIDAITGVITTVAGTGVSGYNGDGMLATTAQLNYPYGVYYDKQTGGIYISDNANHRVRFVNTLGIISTIAGNGLTVGVHDGGPATNAACCPTNVCKDGVGNLYISDGCFRTVRKMNTVGIISTIAGDTSGYIYNGDGILATTAKIAPGYICLDDSGLVCIPDNYNHRVRKVDASGIIHTIAGNGINAYNGDNGPATIASINQPNAVRFDKCGNLYIAQINTPRIRKVWFAGIASPPVATITAAPNDTVCVGTALTLTCTVSGADSVVSYKWYVNGTVVSGATNAIYSYMPTNGDTVNCKAQSLVDCNGAFIDTSNTIHIVTIATGTPTISLSGISTAALGATVTITGSVSGAGGSYLIRWMNHGSVFATTSVPLVTYIKGSGTDTITARIVPTGSCYDSAFGAAHIVTVDHTGILEFEEGSGVTIYPNPTNDFLHIINKKIINNYTISDITGRHVMTGALNPVDNELDIQQLNPGIYILQLQYSTGERLMFKVWKR